MSKEGFRITFGAGFHVGFENGYVISVQFGPGNYGDHYSEPINDASFVTCGKRGSRLAEIAVCSRDGVLELHAYESAAFFAELVARVSAAKPGEIVKQEGA